MMTMMWRGEKAQEEARRSDERTREELDTENGWTLRSES
jgi:hypothetical protein